MGTDSSAAKSFVSRGGLGKMRHIEIRDLWLQKEVLKGMVKVVKVAGEDNPADLMTKFLPVKVIRKHFKGMGMEVTEGNGLRKEVAGGEEKGEGVPARRGALARATLAVIRAGRTPAQC